VLEGFKLLNTAMQYDMGAAEAINTMTVRERVSPLHVQLVNPPRRLAVLLQYVLYNNMDLQYEVSFSFSFNVFSLSLTKKLIKGTPDRIDTRSPPPHATCASSVPKMLHVGTVAPQQWHCPPGLSWLKP
jgi:hypothetical protein